MQTISTVFAKSGVLLVLVLMATTAQSQVSGTVFRDFNFNGARTTVSGGTSTAEPLVAGVVVNAYNSANQLIASYTTTNGSGTAATYPYTGNNFSIPASGTAYNGTPGSNTGFVPSGTAVRLEFVAGSSTCAANIFDPSSKSGTANGTSVQFVTAPSTTVSYAINNPADYNTGTTGASLYTPVYTVGDPLGGGAAGTDNWFVGFPYTNTGSTVPVQRLAGSQVGTLWGVAYSKQSKKIFTSAFLKRHTGLGPMGSGGIYLLTPTASSFTVVQFFDMDNNAFNTAANPVTRTRADASAPAYGNGSSYTLSNTNRAVTFNGSTDPVSGFPSGLGVLGTNTQRGLPAAGGASYDGPAFDQVGKVGLGDIDISDDGKYLFVMNLYQRKVFRLELNDAYNPTAVISVASYDVPAQSCNNGVLRPFATKFYKNKLYVGTICSGENEATNTNANLSAQIFELNNATGAASFNASPVLTYPLTYTKGLTSATSDSSGTRWYPWVNDVSKLRTDPLSGLGLVWLPQPMLSDIEFTDKGDILMSFMDRTGHQTGYQNRYYLGGGLTTLTSTEISGDILISGKNCPAGYTLENNGSYNTDGVTFSSTPNGQGPGGGEFFRNDISAGGGFSPYAHNENSMGAMAVLSGTNSLKLTIMDPAQSSSGGLVNVSVSNAAVSGTYELYAISVSTPNYLAKANGLGDLEVLTPLSPLEVGNRIWLDANGNGIQDAGETTAGVPAGTTVTLRSPGPDGIYGNGDDQTWTTTTDANGNYYFSTLSSSDNRRTAGMVSSGNYANQLLPGFDYRIEITTPTGVQLTKTNAAANSADNIDNDASLNGTTAIVAFNTANTNHNFDIGFKPQASIGDKVWRDDDKDGIQDTGEPGVAGITVTLYQNGPDGLPGTADDTVVGTTVTDAYGNYFFDNLPASTSAATSFNIGFTPPANYQFTTQTNTQITGTSNATNTTTTTGGSTAANGSDANTVTGRTGSFWLAPGEAETGADAGLIFSTPATTNSLGNRVWLDTDGGGDQDANEPGVSGVTVTLYAADGVTVVATTITDANGNYLFTNLPANTNFIIGVTPPAGMLFTASGGTTPANDTDSDVNGTVGAANFGKSTIVNTGATGTQTLTIDAGLLPQNVNKCALGDRVWYDNDRDGLQDPGEPGIAAVTVTLLNNVGVTIATTVTDAYGNYIFPNLDPGIYRIQFGTVPGMQLTAPNASGGTVPDAEDSDANPADGITGLYALAAGSRNMSVDAGFYSTQPAANVGALGDKVWNDIDGDGIQDANEPGVAGVTVTLYNSLGVAIATTSTDANGNYLFPNLTPGSYSVGFSNLPAGFGFTAQDAGGNDTIDSDANPATGRTGLVAVTGGNTNTTLDAGIRNTTPSGLGSIGNKVFVDLDSDGIQDAGELGVAGVTVTLLDAGADGIVGNGDDGPSRTTATNALGEYLFDGLPAGNYAVQFSAIPAGYTVTTANTGADDALDSDGGALGTGGAPAGTSRTGIINLLQGEDNLTVDLGLVTPPATNTLGDFVWFDSNSNGLQDGSEPGVPGVVVTLYISAGTVVATTTTDATGRYLFTGLPDGNYSVGFSNLPAGYDLTTKSATNDLTGSDADRITGITNQVTLNYAAGGTSRDNRSLDAGLVSTRAALGDRVWSDLDANGIQDAGEPGVAGVTVSLFRPGFGPDGIAGNADDALPVASMITDANGNYFFPNLIPGDYQVEFSTIPNGMVFTQQVSPGDNQNNTNSDAVPANPNGRSGTISLSAGETDLTVDAGLIVPQPATIGNRVWADIDKDGLQSPGEPGVAGVIVTLYNAGNQPIGSAVTDGNGNWQITNVPTGTGYYVVFTPNLPGFDVSGTPGTNPAWTLQNVGTNGTSALDSGTESDADSDVSPSGANPGRTGTFGVVPGNNFPNIDAGIINWPLVNILPINLVSFTAQPQGGTVRLSWVVDAEINVLQYEIEYSRNSTDFISIGSTPATGNRNYGLVHSSPRQGLNYYRLKVTDKDGKISYSEVRKVNFGKADVVTVFPVPAHSEMNITLPGSLVNKAVMISVIAMDGKIMISKQVAAASQTETLDVHTLASGRYTVRIMSGTTLIIKSVEVMRQGYH